jgi:hypothetical protein
MDTDQHSAKESKQRLQKILKGAFSGPPTPLKDIPTRWGEQRAERKTKSRRKPRRLQKKICVKKL